MFQTYGFICHACKEAAIKKTTFGETFQSDSLDLTPKSSESESSLNVTNLTANIWYSFSYVNNNLAPLKTTSGHYFEFSGSLFKNIKHPW